MEWGPRPEPEPPPWTDAHPDPPYALEVRPGVRTLGGGSVTPWSLYFVFLVYVWVGQGVTWVYMLGFVLGFVLIGIVYD